MCPWTLLLGYGSSRTWNSRAAPSEGIETTMTDPPDPREFATTHWSLVLAATAGEANRTQARRALEELCRAYWYPLYAFARHRGYSADDAQDSGCDVLGCTHASQRQGGFEGCSYTLVVLAQTFFQPAPSNKAWSN